MGQFFLMFRCYLYRLAKDPIGILVCLLLPLTLVIFNVIISESVIEGYYHIVDGYNIQASTTAIIIVLMFQFFASTFVSDGLYKEMRGPLRWRLLAAPASANSYVFANFLASIIVSVLLGVLVFAASALFFDAYFPNLLLLLVVLVITSTFAQLSGMFLFLFIPYKRVTEAVLTLFTFAMVGGRGMLVGELGLAEPLDFFFNYITPYAIAMRILLHSGFTGVEPLVAQFNIEIGSNMDIVITNMGLLLAMTTVLAIVVALRGRRRWF